MPKNWCFQTVVLEKTLESPLECKEIKPINPKGNQPWIFIGRTDAKVETPVLLPPKYVVAKYFVKSWLIGKDLDSGKDWEQEEKQATEDEIFGWHHGLNPVDVTLSKLWEIVEDRKAWCGAVHGGHKVPDLTKRLNNNSLFVLFRP